MADSDSDADRRYDTRISRVNLVQISRFDEAGFRADLATGRTLNISRGGIRLELHHPLPLRSEVTLNLVLGNDIIDVAGTVTYLEVLDVERCAMGIRFEDLDSRQQEALDAFVTASEKTTEKS